MDLKSLFKCIIFSYLEYFDYMLFITFYPLIAKRLPQNLFIENEIFVFIIAYASKPIGGFLFGKISDKFNPKLSLTIIPILSFISSIYIALYLSFSKLILSTALLILCRILQGISCGASLPSILGYVNNNQKNTRNFIFSIIFSSFVLGSVSAHLTYVFYLLLTKESNIIYGYKLPFIFGGIISLLSLIIRVGFITKNKPSIKTKNKASNKFLQYILLICFYSVQISFIPVIFNLLPNIYSNKYHMNNILLNFYSSISLIFMVISSIFFGYIKDIKLFKYDYNLKLILIYSCILIILLYFSKFNPITFLICSSFSGIIIGSYSGFVYNFLTSRINENIFTSIGIITGISTLIFSSLSVLIFNSLKDKSETLFMIIYFLFPIIFLISFSSKKALDYINIKESGRNYA